MAAPAVIEICGIIDRALADRVERQIAELHSHDALTVRIASHGGDPAFAVRIARALRAHRGHTTAHVTGQCDSAAIIVLAAARSRYAGPDAKFRLHATSSYTVPRVAGRATVTMLRAEAVRLERIDRSMREFIAACTGTPAEDWTALEEREAVLDARQALNVGLLTQVFGKPEWTAERDGRRQEAAARSPLTMPGAAAVRFSPAEVAALAQRFAGRPFGIAPAALKAMLREQRP